MSVLAEPRDLPESGLLATLWVWETACATLVESYLLGHKEPTCRMFGGGEITLGLKFDSIIFYVPLG